VADAVLEVAAAVVDMAGGADATAAEIVAIAANDASVTDLVSKIPLPFIFFEGRTMRLKLVEPISGVQATSPFPRFFERRGTAQRASFM
jgi:hypothetical protein